jgi:hypothetical protein
MVRSQTFVGVVSASISLAMPDLIHSYATPGGLISSAPQGYGWRVIDATLATTATLGLFDPAAINHNGSAHRFQDPSHSGFSNSTVLAIEEARCLSSGGDSHVVLSLGGALRNLIEPINRPLKFSLAESGLGHLERVASDTEAVHRSAWSDLEK